MRRAIIIGAGLAGLSVAYHLELQGRTDYRIFEKQPEVGGLCRSFTVGNFTFDYAIHILYSSDEYAKNLIKNKLLKNNFNSQIRKSFIRYRGIYTEYPFQANLYGQDADVIKECILGLVRAKCGHAKTPKNFYEWVNSTFGEGIAKHFMIPYNQKQWAISPKEMNCDWISGRVPIPSIEEVLEGALRPPQRRYGPNAYFWYPLRGGTGALPNAFLPHIRNVNLNSEVSRIYLRSKEAEVNGRRVGYDRIASTIPLTKLISLIDDVPSKVEHAAGGLEWNVIYAVNLGIDRANILKYHWVYFPEEKPIFHRISLPMNLSPFMAPRGKSSITAEISASKHKLLKIDKKDLADAVVDDLIECGVMHKNDRVLFKDLRCLNPAYVIYDRNRRENIRVIRDFLIKNDIYPCGRFGDWEYMNMDRSIVRGKEAAEKI